MELFFTVQIFFDIFLKFFFISFDNHFHKKRINLQISRIN